MSNNCNISKFKVPESIEAPAVLSKNERVIRALSRYLNLVLERNGVLGLHQTIRTLLSRLFWKPGSARIEHSSKLSNIHLAILGVVFPRDPITVSIIHSEFKEDLNRICSLEGKFLFLDKKIRLILGFGQHAVIDKLDQLLKKISNQEIRNLSTDQLSSLLGYERTYLSSKIKRLTGETLSGLIQSEKIRRAILMLSNDEECPTVEKVSSVLGFCHSDYFRKRFSQFLGVPPSFFQESKKSAGFQTSEESKPLEHNIETQDA